MAATTSPVARSFEYWLLTYRRTWRGSVVSGVLNPILFLAAMGLGLGSLVDAGGNAGGLGGVDYVVFIAPGLLAATAMQTAAGESTYPVMGAIKWERTYHAMLTTPLQVRDVLLGHLAFIAVRVTMTSTIYLGIMAAFGAARSWSVLLALPAAVLTGMAFATPVAAMAARMENDAGFAALFRFGIMPLFLFSGTFFPIGQLPELIRPVAYVTPLWHGVSLCRALALGTAGVAATAGHVAYLSALVLGGAWLAARIFRERLVS